MKCGQHEIYSYQTYIKNNNIHTMRLNPLVVLDKFGFTPMIGVFEPDKGEKPIELVKSYAQSMKAPTVLVFYRKNDSWGCPIIEVFYKAKG